MAEPILEVKNIFTNYGSIQALKGISLEVYPGEIVTLIGSNGAGKSTTLGSITDITPVSSGQIVFNGTDITKYKPSDITKLGIAVSPEGREVFGGLSVQENLRIGAYTVKDKKQIEASYQQVYELFRAMMSQPKLLLLDEPSMGLSPNLVEVIFELIERIHKSGTTVLLIEQNANMALSIANRGYVLESGRISLTGKARDLLRNDDVRRAYLGSAE